MQASGNGFIPPCASRCARCWSRPLKPRLRQLKRRQRAVSCKRTGSHNRTKATHRLASLHRKVANQRADTMHRFTSRLAKTKSVVVIEDLNVAGMLKNQHL